MSRTAKYVDRDQVFPLCRGESILANPYTHLPLATTRARWQVNTLEEALHNYTQWLDFSIVNDIEVNRAMFHIYNRAITLYKEHRAIYLACWCKDEVDPYINDHGCHCDYVRDRLIQKWLLE